MVMLFDGGNTSNTKARAPRTSSKSVISNVAPKTSSFGPYASGYKGRTSPSTPKITSYVAPPPAASPYSGPPSLSAGGSAGGGSGSGGSGYGDTGSFGVDGGGALGAVTTPPIPTDEEFLSGDAGYQRELAALERALADYKTQNTTERDRYGVNFNEGLRNLGWAMKDDEATPDVFEGSWNLEDTNFAAGRGFQNLRNDFAARGLLQSSDYGNARSNFDRGLNEQKSSMERDRSTFLSDLASQLGAFENENTDAKNAAKAEALARKAAQYLAV